MDHFHQVYNFISASSAQYPQIEAWYWDKVVREIVVNQQGGRPESRRIEVVHRDQMLAGVSSVKESAYVPGVKEFGFNEFTRWY